MKVIAILLAAGESTRMGRAKPMLPWQRTTLVEYQVKSLLSGGVTDVYVVTGRSDRDVAPILERMNHAHRVYNPDFAQGKTTSIKAGISAIPEDTDAIVLLAVDQPRPAWVIRRTVESHLSSGAPLTSPRYRGHGGHPLVFAGSLRDELLAISEEAQGIREVFSRHEHAMNALEFGNEVIRLDLNTPESYESAVSEYPRLAAQQAQTEN